MPSLISAVFCLKPRARGQSALFDSLSYLSSPQSSWDHTLVGWTGEIAGDPCLTREDRDKVERDLSAHHSGKVAPVWLSDQSGDIDGLITLKDQERWRRYGEHELYTLFHYKQHEPTDGRKERLWWADYYRMNKAFADKIVALYKPGDYIWIHDYHLFLLPALLRQRFPNAFIGFFLHIPWPSSEFLRCLSRRKEIIEGVLGSSLIGFQSYGYSRHFSSCCKRILGFESSPVGVDAYGAHVAVDVFPIGISASATEKFAFYDPDVSVKIQKIKDMYAGKKIIVGRDRLDSVRGVAQKLQAFEKFLKRYPEWRDNVVLIQVTSPTSITTERDDGSGKIANKISDLVSIINGEHGSLSFSPVRHYPQYISREEYFALLRVADVGLITSVRDGMNTASLEFVVCQKGNFGPLILSEFSGTAGSLSSAIHINPWDLEGVASAIERALTMPEAEREAQFTRLYDHVSTNTVQAWAEKYLNRLVTTVSLFGKSANTPSLDKTMLLAKYRVSEKRLFMFDYDGTLTPIVKDPQSAIPSDRVIRTLKILSADPKNSVWIISGRDQAFLDEWMGHIPELGLSAEHGSFIRHPLMENWENITEKTDMSWQEDVMQIFHHFTEKTQGSFIERKKVALTWHYRRADPEYGKYQAKECREHLLATAAKKYDVEVMEGKANLEVRPNFVNKGAIAKRLIAEYADDGKTSDTGQADINKVQGAERKDVGAPDFVFCLGDDFTDEDMFRALNASSLPRDSVFSCTVGASSKQTDASWHLLEPSDVISTIAMLNGVTDDKTLGPVSVVDGYMPEKRV